MYEDSRAHGEIPCAPRLGFTLCLNILGAIQCMHVARVYKDASEVLRHNSVIISAAAVIVQRKLYSDETEINSTMGSARLRLEPKQKREMQREVDSILADVTLFLLLLVRRGLVPNEAVTTVSNYRAIWGTMTKDPRGEFYSYFILFYSFLTYAPLFLRYVYDAITSQMKLLPLCRIIPQFVEFRRRGNLEILFLFYFNKCSLFLYYVYDLVSFRMKLLPLCRISCNLGNSDDGRRVTLGILFSLYFILFQCFLFLYSFLFRLHATTGRLSK